MINGDMYRLSKRIDDLERKVNRMPSSDTVSLRKSIAIGPSSGDASIELGGYATGNRQAYIDLHGDDTYTDYGLRIIRTNGGANGNSAITHRGTGDLSIAANEAGRITLLTNNTLAFYIDGSQRCVAKSGVMWLKRDLTDFATRRNWSIASEVLSQGDFAISISTSNTGNPVNAKLTISSGGFVGIGNNFSATHLLQLDTDDAAKPGTNTWTVVSDARTKRNVAPFQGGLKELLALPNPVSFEYNGRAGTPAGQKGTGFNAQDIAPVKPEWVRRSMGKLNPDDAADTEILALNTGEMQFMLLNAIRELSSRLSLLEKRPQP